MKRFFGFSEEEEEESLKIEYIKKKRTQIKSGKCAKNWKNENHNK